MIESTGRNNRKYPHFRGATNAWSLVIACLLLTGPQASHTAILDRTVDSEVVDLPDSRGPVRLATVDRHGTTWLATHRELLKVEHGRLSVVVPGVSEGPIPMVAPGGERYALLDSRRAAYGQFAVELFDLNRPGSSLAVLQPSEPPYGFGALHIGRTGKILVGGVAMDDPEGLNGDFRFTFWSEDGEDESSVVVNGRRIGILDDQGESILLIGESDATAYRKDGSLRWLASGHFRKGALSLGGEVALLNPANAIDEVHLVRSGASSRILKAPAPVYDLAITPDGSLGAVTVGAGKIFIIELQACPGNTCRARQLPSLPVLSTHYVTALRFVSHRLLALGVIQAAGAGPYRRFFGGTVIVQRVSGALIFHDMIPLPEPATWSPSLDVTFGSDTFAAYTPKAAMYVRVRE